MEIIVGLATLGTTYWFFATFMDTLLAQKPLEPGGLWIVRVFFILMCWMGFVSSILSYIFM